MENKILEICSNRVKENEYKMSWKSCGDLDIYTALALTRLLKERVAELEYNMFLAIHEKNILKGKKNEKN